MIQGVQIRLEKVVPFVQGVLPAQNVSGRTPFAIPAIPPTGSGVLPRALRPGPVLKWLAHVDGQLPT